MLHFCHVLVIATVLSLFVGGSHEASSAQSCVIINGQWKCTSNNDPNGNTAVSTSGDGTFAQSCAWINGQWRCTNSNNPNGGEGVYGGQDAPNSVPNFGQGFPQNFFPFGQQFPFNFGRR